jgi:hypothetical protein
MRNFDLALPLIRDDIPFGAALGRLGATVSSANTLGALARLLPANADEWEFASAIIDYDPRPAMSQLRVPLLALYGGDDDVVPVPESLRAVRGSMATDLLRSTALAGADRRMYTTDGDTFADGYLQTLSAFVAVARP